MSELEWQALGAIATIIGILIAVWLAPDARRWILEHAKRVYRVTSRFFKITIVRVGIVCSLSLALTSISTLLIYNWIGNFTVLIGMAVLGLTLTFLSTLAIFFRDVDAQFRQLSAAVEQLQSSLASIEAHEANYDLGEVKQRWPEFCQELSQDLGNAALYAILSLSTPISVEELVILAEVPGVLRATIASFDSGRVEPLLKQIYGKPYRLELRIVE
jgi:hypothetical protein